MAGVDTARLSAVQFRPAILDDADAITDHHHRCWVVSFTHLLPDGAIDLLRPEAMLDAWHERLAPDSGVTAVVAVDESGHVVGHTSVEGDEVVTLYVDPDHQGQGTGAVLLAEAERLIAASGHDRAELRTVVGNEAAIGFYRAAGWDVTDQIVRSEEYGMVFDEQILVKVLR